MRPHWLLPTLVLVAAGAIVATLGSGTPDPLPGIALGSDLLLHIERGAAVFAVAVTVLAVLVRGARGELPVEFGTGALRYEAGELAGKVGRLSEELADQGKDFAAEIAAAKEAIRALELEVGRLEDRGVPGK